MKIYYGMGSGLRQNLDFNDFKSLPIPIPPAEEQYAIVKYVRHVERKIGAAIQVKRQLVTLLAAQKRAIVHQAVTGGLAPSVEFKEAGVPWVET
ncbi:restriction endonuclease subunit S, partial [Micromonospora harpali]